MEIYSPGSKSKALFKQNRLKSEHEMERGEPDYGPTQTYFRPEPENETEKEPMLRRVARLFGERMKAFFEYDEAIR